MKFTAADAFSKFATFSEVIRQPTTGITNGAEKKRYRHLKGPFKRNMIAVMTQTYADRRLIEQELPVSPVFDGMLYNEPDGSFSILACLQCIEQVASLLFTFRAALIRRSLIRTRRSSRSEASWEFGGPPPTSKSTVM